MEESEDLQVLLPLTPVFQCSDKLWYLVFKEVSSSAPWWMRLASFKHRKYGHVLAVRQLTNRHALVIDPGTTYCSADLYRYEEDFSRVIARLAQKYKVVSIIHSPVPFWNLTCLVPSCVTVLKYHLGLNSRALTPKQLHDDLVKNYSAAAL